MGSFVWVLAEGKIVAVRIRHYQEVVTKRRHHIIFSSCKNGPGFLVFRTLSICRVELGFEKENFKGNMYNYSLFKVFIVAPLTRH